LNNTTEILPSMKKEYSIVTTMQLNESSKNNSILHYVSYLIFMGDKTGARKIIEKHFSDNMNDQNIKYYLMEIESDKPCGREQVEQQIKKGVINPNSSGIIIKQQYLVR